MVPFLSWHLLASECVLLADFPAQHAPCWSHQNVFLKYLSLSLCHPATVTPNMTLILFFLHINVRGSRILRAYLAPMFFLNIFKKSLTLRIKLLGVNNPVQTASLQLFFTFPFIELCLI